jgi:hypothetical protein
MVKTENAQDRIPERFYQLEARFARFFRGADRSARL